jgi:hypothetical protein
MADGHRTDTLGLRDVDAGEEVARAFIGGSKGDLLKILAGIAIAAIAAYYAIGSRIAVIENDVSWIKQAVRELRDDARAAAPKGAAKP